MLTITNQNIVEDCLRNIDMLQSHIQHVEAAVYYANQCRHKHGLDAGTLRQTLIEEELDQWRSLFMWGLTVDEQVRARIRAAAYDRFLSHGKEICQWLNAGHCPSAYLVADEEEFRKLVDRLFLTK